MFDRNLFLPVSGDAAAALFKAHVGNVEIETFSYCNRVCPYCPNSQHDRRSFKTFMSQQNLDKLLQGLVAIDYGNQIVLSHYNEPMSNSKIIDHVSMFRKAAPRSTLSMYSNGDYLDRDMFDALVGAGLDNLVVSIHLGPTEQYDDKKVINRLMDMSRLLDIQAEIYHFDPGKMVHAKFNTKALKTFYMLENNFLILGQDRGGILENIQKPELRSAPCSYPFNTFNITYNGNISPCCQIRGDIPHFKDIIIGNLDSFASIFDAYGSKAAADWRRSLYTRSAKEGPCRTCTAGIVELDEDTAMRREELFAALETQLDTADLGHVAVESPQAEATLLQDA